MLLLALHLATVSIQPAPPPAPDAVMANPDGGKKRRGDGKDDEDVR